MGIFPVPQSSAANPLGGHFDSPKRVDKKHTPTYVFGMVLQRTVCWREACQGTRALDVSDRPPGSCPMRGLRRSEAPWSTTPISGGPPWRKLNTCIQIGNGAEIG